MNCDLRRSALRGLLFGLLMTVCGFAGATPPAASVLATPAPTNIPKSSFLSNLDGLTLIDQDGVTFDPQTLTGQVVLFNFIFTRCASTCPTQTKDLVSVQKQLAPEIQKDIRFVSVSVDPKYDAPEKLKAFSQKLHADLSHWSFLTGEPEQVETLLNRLKIFDPNAQAVGPEVHRTSLWLVDKNGRMLQRYKGDPVDKKRLVRELPQITNLSYSAVKTL